LIIDDAYARQHPFPALTGSKDEVCRYCGKLVRTYPCVFWMLNGDIWFHVDCAKEFGNHLIFDAMRLLHPMGGQHQ
jgi:hypothetical protein